MQARKIESAIVFSLQMETHEAQEIVSGLTKIEAGQSVSNSEALTLVELRNCLRDVFGSVRK